MKELLKSDSICKSYSQLKKGPVFWLTVCISVPTVHIAHLQQLRLSPIPAASLASSTNGSSTKALPHLFPFCVVLWWLVTVSTRHVVLCTVYSCLFLQTLPPRPTPHICLCKVRWYARICKRVNTLINVSLKNRTCIWSVWYVSVIQLANHRTLWWGLRTFPFPDNLAIIIKFCFCVHYSSTVCILFVYDCREPWRFSEKQKKILTWLAATCKFPVEETPTRAVMLRCQAQLDSTGSSRRAHCSEHWHRRETWWTRRRC